MSGFIITQSDNDGGKFKALEAYCYFYTVYTILVRNRPNMTTVTRLSATVYDLRQCINHVIEVETDDGRIFGIINEGISYK